MLRKGKNLPKFSPFIDDGAWIWNQVFLIFLATCWSTAGIILFQYCYGLTFSMFKYFSCFVFKSILYPQLLELSWQIFSKLYLGSGQLLIGFKKLLCDSTCIILKYQFFSPLCPSVTQKMDYPLNAHLRALFKSVQKKKKKRPK